MLNRQPQAISKNLSQKKQSQSNHNSTNQHGLFLLDIPSESLTHITSFLDPPSLLALSKVNSILYHHVKDDNTWHRAFVYQLLGIGPEHDLNDDKSLLLRPAERSWRTEFIIRYNLRRRWERSRNSTVSHVPLQHSPVASMHLMPANSLLTSSLEYGIVARSIPLTGKILRGYLDASGTGTGLGIGNPNVEFTPNVSACSLSSDGGTAKILWGFRNGDVAVTTASKAMDVGGGVNGRSAAKLVRNKVADQHEGNVADVAWDEGKSFFVSGGADGKVKLWDAKKVECIWTSERQIGTLIKDPCARVATVLGKGVIVGAMQSGEIVLWTGFKLESLLSEDKSSATSIREIRISSVVIASPDNQDSLNVDISSLYIDTSATSSLSLLASYNDHPYFYRFRVDPVSGSVEHAVFGDSMSFGRIQSLKPFYSSRATDSSFIITGDSLGCVSIYEWNVISPSPPSTPIVPARKFEAYEDASSVTAIAWNGVTLMTGSNHGIIRVWDGLTFEHLKSFTNPIPKIRVRAMAIHQPVAQAQREVANQILISPEGDVVIASIGDTIMAWRAGPVSKSTGGMRKVTAAGKKNRDQTAAAKYFKQLEFHQTISESRKALEQEHEHVQKVFGREREQRERLEKLGLDEVEAVSYVLMLSRDEEMHRLAAIASQGASDASGSGSTAVEEGVFEGDFDDVADEATPDESASMSSMTGRYQPSSSLLSEAPSHPFITASYHRASTSPQQSQPLGRPIPRVSPSKSNAKIQVSPRFRPEPIEAGSIQESGLTLELPEPVLPLTEDESDFPPISTSISPASLGGLSISITPNRSPSGSWVRSPILGTSSPQSTSRSTSAWGISHSRSEGPSPGSSFAPQASWAITPPRNNLRLTASPSSRTDGALNDDEMDEDLRFAIELSLVEARSRGADV